MPQKNPQQTRPGRQLGNLYKPDLFNKLPKSSKIILALSGGPDSIFLFHQALNYFNPQNIIIAHFNHKTRPIGNFLDQKFIEKLSKKHNIKLITKKNTTKNNSENSMREQRYKFLETIRKQQNFNFILTAHHQNDQIETQLLRLTRGTTFTGLTGINPFDQTRHLYRPLLSLTKTEILSNLKQNRHSFRNDPSNRNNKFSRNFIRNKIIPLFSKINPNFTQTFSQTAKLLAETQTYLEKTAQSWLTSNLIQTKTTQSLPQSDFISTEPILQKYIIGKLYRNLNNSNLTHQHLTELLKTINKKKSGISKSFGPKFLLTIQKNTDSKRYIVIKSKFQ